MRYLSWLALGVAFLALYLSATNPSGVAVGRHDAGGGVSIAAASAGSWANGILIRDGAIARDGAVIGLSQSTPMRNGLDLASGRFSDAAVRLGNDQLIRLDGAGQSAPAGFRNDANGFLQIVGGASGVVIRSNDNTRTLVSVKNDGTVEVENGVLVLRDPEGRRFRLVVGVKGEPALVPVR